MRSNNKNTDKPKSGFSAKKDSKSSFKKPSSDKPRSGFSAKKDGKPKDGKPSESRGKSFAKRSDKDAVSAKPRAFSKRDDKDKDFKKPYPKKDGKYSERSFKESPFSEDKGSSGEFVYGRHPVSELLDSDVQINKVWIDEHFKDTRDVFEKVKSANIPYQLVNKAKLNNLVGEVNHQGLVASISEIQYSELHDLIDMAQTKEVFFIILDKVEDPHNLGAIIRTADATGVDAIIIPKHGAVGVTGVVAKTAAGSLARMKICRVTNLSQAVERLKENNIWVGAVDMDGKDLYTQGNLKGNITIVLGGEGKGLSKTLRDNCDFSLKIPMKSHSNSLNVSVATAVVCYEAFKQRGFKP